jgi:hypothetical protein
MAYPTAARHGILATPFGRGRFRKSEIELAGFDDQFSQGRRNQE